MTPAAVLFDLYGTLVYDRYARPQEMDALTAAMAAALGAEPDGFARWWGSTYADRFGGRWPDTESALLAYCASAGLSPAPGVVARCAAVNLGAVQEALYGVREGAAAVLAGLQARGARLGLVSDCAPATARAFAGASLAPHMDAAAFSCAEGACKPDARLWLACLDRLGARAEGSVYVADGNSGELEAARALGMRSVMIKCRTLPDDEGFWRVPDWDGPRVTELAELEAIL